MTSQLFQTLFSFNHYTLRENTRGLSQEDSLLQPPGGGNCLNWVVGHLLASRDQILALVGAEPVWSAGEAARYARGSEPLTAAAEARPLADMLAAFDRSQERLLAALKEMYDDAFVASAGKDGKETVGRRLALLQFHEAYHVGQTALLRRMAGKPGAIR